MYYTSLLWQSHPVIILVRTDHHCLRVGRHSSKTEKRIVRIARPDHPVSPKAKSASGQQHKQWVSKVVSSADGSGGNQDQTGPRSETLTNDEAKHNTEKGPEEIAEKQNKAPGEQIEIKAKVVASTQQQPNRTVWFDKPDYPISLGSGQKRTLRTTVPRTAPAPRWCPPRLMPSQGRRI
jgi:hypothetical protein